MKCNKVRQTCGTKVFTACIEHQLPLGESTKITDECYNLEEIVTDIYELLDEVKSETDLLSLESCTTLPTEKTVKNLFQHLIDEICNLKSDVGDLQSTVTQQAQQIEDLQTQNCP